MKFFLANLAVNLVSLSFAGFAVYLAVHSKDGWGWFLFAAIICAGYAKTTSSDKS